MPRRLNFHHHNWLYDNTTGTTNTDWQTYTIRYQSTAEQMRQTDETLARLLREAQPPVGCPVPFFHLENDTTCGEPSFPGDPHGRCFAHSEADMPITPPDYPF